MIGLARLFLASSCPAVSVRPAYITADDCMRILLGLPVVNFPTRIEDTPLSPVTIVPVTLITAKELETLRQGGAAERKALADTLAQSGRHHVVAFKRTD